MNATKTSGIDESYLALIRRFPLRRIIGKDDHAAAMKIARELSLKDPESRPSGESDYFGALASIIDAYERVAFPIGRTMKPLDVLRQLLEANDLTSKDLGDVIGSKSAASMILNGERGMSKAQIVRIANRFKVSPAILMEPAEPVRRARARAMA